MNQNHDREVAFLQEPHRALGPPDATVFYSIASEATDLSNHLEQLRQLPSDIGYHEMLRRLGLVPPHEAPGTEDSAL